jgi:hypothetical protein
MYIDNDLTNKNVTPRRRETSMLVKPAKPHDFTSLSPQKLISLYAELSSSSRVKDFLIKHVTDNLINEITIKYFIEYGLLHGFIYRMHRYALHANPFLTSHTFGANMGQDPQQI